MRKQATLLGSQPQATKLPADCIGTVKHASVRSVTEKCHPESIRQILRHRSHSAGQEYQCAAAVSSSKSCRPIDDADVEILPPVVHPPQVTVAVEIAELPGRSRRGDGFGGAQEDHPVTTQLDGFLVRHAPRSRCWWLRSHDFQSASRDRLPTRVGEES